MLPSSRHMKNHTRYLLPLFYERNFDLGPTVLISDLIYIWRTISASLAWGATKIQGVGSGHRADMLNTGIIMKRRDWLAKSTLPILFCSWTDSTFLSPKGRGREDRKKGNL